MAVDKPRRHMNLATRLSVKIFLVLLSVQKNCVPLPWQPHLLILFFAVCKALALSWRDLSLAWKSFSDVTGTSSKQTLWFWLTFLITAWKLVSNWVKSALLSSICFTVISGSWSLLLLRKSNN